MHGELVVSTDSQAISPGGRLGVGWVGLGGRRECVMLMIPFVRTVDLLAQMSLVVGQAIYLMSFTWCLISNLGEIKMALADTHY